MSKYVSNGKVVFAFIVLIIGVLCLVSSGVLYAAENYTVFFIEDNELSTGDIRIEIVESEIAYTGNNSNGLVSEEVPFVDGKTVLPGQTLSKIVRINNIAEPAYIRVKVDYESDNVDDDRIWLSDENIVLGNDDWVKIGDYYYYKDIVSSIDQSNPSKVSLMPVFIREVIIPDDLTNVYELSDFAISITAEAIQAKNFTPDFSTSTIPGESNENNGIIDPWFGTVVLACEHNDDYESIVSVDSSVPFEVEYSSDLGDEIIADNSNFFSNWGTLMPGDNETDTFIITNLPGARDIYFHTEKLDEDDLELASVITLIIRNGDNVIYNGALSGTVSPILLGTFNQSSTDEITYSISIPSYLNNDYSLKNAKVRWVFSADENVEEPLILPNSGSYDFMIYFLLLLGSICILSSGFLLVSNKKRGGNNA